MNDITKLDTSKLKEQDKKFNPQAITPPAVNPLTAMYLQGTRAGDMYRQTGVMPTTQSVFDNEYGTNEENLKDMNEHSARIPGLIQQGQQMAPRQSNAYGGDQSYYDAIDRRAQANYQQDLGSFGAKLKQQDFEYRQDRLGQENQRFQSIRQYEQAKQNLRDFQRAEKKRKRGAVVGNVLGVVGAVVGGILGGPAGAQGGMAAGQGIGNAVGGA
jgi:hypothetical protein